MSNVVSVKLQLQCINARAYSSAFHGFDWYTCN